MAHIEARSDDGLGVALAGAVGFGLGLACGVVVAEWLGNVDSDRVKEAVRRLRPVDDEPADTDAAGLAQALRDALQGEAALKPLGIRARALGNGIVELTGTAPDERTRELAREVAGGVPGADVVVNRILVDGIDTGPQAAAGSEK